MSTLKDFREAMHREAERTPAPRLRVLLDRERPAQVLHWRWAAAAAILIAAAGFVLPREDPRQQEQADARLMQEVNAALARSAPRAFAALMAEGN